MRYDALYPVNGRQREKSFKRKAYATKFRATVEADLARGDWIDERRSKQTVAEFAEAGLRIGEAFGLQVGDLDFNAGRVEVQRTASENPAP